jgi:hypothetical protein
MKEAANIVVLRANGGESLAFEVLVRDAEGESRHKVTMTQSAYEKLSGGKYAPETCVEAAFRFLLDREPKGAILSDFSIAVISKYFPEFEQTLPSYLPPP